MKVAVAHHSLNIPGGAERLSLTLVEALQRRGHDVVLVTVEKTDWSFVRRSFGNVSMPQREHYALKMRASDGLSSMSIASTYFLLYVLQLLASKWRDDCDLVVNTFGDVINSIADVAYVHFPLRAALRFSQIPAFARASMWRAVAPLYNSTMALLEHCLPGKLITNSRFMQGIIKEVLCREAVVVYPPVDVSAFSSRFSGEKTGSLVATVSSYTPKRHLEQVPLIAKQSKSGRFVVIGKADEYSAPVLRQLKKQIRELHVEDRVTLLMNASSSELTEVLSRARVYLHVMPYDHFGISIVEAMASGCVPVVHRSGGPWLDILDGRQGEYGFSYGSVDEAAGFIDELMGDESLRRTVTSRALNRAKEFDKPVFMEKMVEVVERFGN
jgi:alpha-1,2-mannosyltransferase